MERTPQQFAQIELCLPVQRGSVSLCNLQVVNAILYGAEHGCKWRGLPRRFGNWHTIYTQMNRWSKLACWFGCSRELQQYPGRVHPDRNRSLWTDFDQGQGPFGGTGALKKRPARRSASPAAAGPLRFVWLPRMLNGQ